jgi:hypothetical protein
MRRDGSKYLQKIYAYGNFIPQLATKYFRTYYG